MIVALQRNYHLLLRTTDIMSNQPNQTLYVQNLGDKVSSSAPKDSIASLTYSQTDQKRRQVYTFQSHTSGLTRSRPTSTVVSTLFSSWQSLGYRSNSSAWNGRTSFYRFQGFAKRYCCEKERGWNGILRQSYGSLRVSFVSGISWYPKPLFVNRGYRMLNQNRTLSSKKKKELKRCT